MSSEPRRMKENLEILMRHQKVVLHKWFLDTFPDPARWFEARLNFTRSAAAWAMVRSAACACVELVLRMLQGGES